MIGNGSGVGIYNWFYVLWRHFRYPYASSLKFVLGQDLAAGFDIAAGLVFGTAGFDLKKTAEPPSAHFLQNSQSLFSRLIFLIWATKCLLLKN